MIDGLRSALRAGALALIFVLSAGNVPAALAAPQELTPDQVRSLAIAAHEAHNAPLARALALALLQRDPNDVLALQILAAAYYAMNGFQDAGETAIRAFRLAKDPRDRHDSARIASEALFRQGRLGAARFWLRRASDFAQDEADRQSDVTAFQGIGRMQRFHYSLDGSISPSSNVNGGSASDTLVLFGLPFRLTPDAQALSGTVASLAFDGQYRLSETERQRLMLGFSLKAKHNWLSARAQRAAPAAKGSDYDFASLDLTLSETFLPEGAKGPYDLSLALGRNWYGGDPLTDHARLGLSKRFVDAEKARQISLFGTLERQYRLDNALRSATVLTFGTEFVKERANHDLYRLRASVENARSNASDVDHKALQLSASYTWAGLVPGVEVTGALELVGRDYDRSVYRIGGRRDLEGNLSLSFFFREKQVMGFAPVVTFSAGGVSSNVSLFERRDLGVELGIRSAF